MRLSLWLIFLALLGLTAGAEPGSKKKLPPREPFEIPLANLSVTIDEKTGVCEKVRIIYEGSKDHVIITALDDIYIKHSRGGTEKTVYREGIDNSYAISAFEAKHINLVSKTLLATLEQFENDLHNSRWGKCLFLDSYFPRFLRGYYYLFCLSMNNSDALPESAKVPDSLYDISLNSEKSDIRLCKWQSTNDYIIKLRIATKELIYQLKLWQQVISRKEKTSTEIELSREFRSSLGLFVSIYFNETLRIKKSSLKR